MEDYIPILNALREGHVQYAVIGTWALKAYFPKQLQEYALHDCDVVLAPQLGNVRLAIQTLHQNGWQAQIWGEHVDATVSVEALAGKYYVRAAKDNLLLDLTYECLIAWPIMQAEITLWNEISLASPKHIMVLKRHKAQELGEEAALVQWLNAHGLEELGEGE